MVEKKKSKYDLPVFERKIISRLPTAEIEKWASNEKYWKIYEVVIAETKKEVLADIGVRIKFYDKWHNHSPYELSCEYPKICDLFMSQKPGAFLNYTYWLFVYCFGDMNKNFQEKIKCLEVKENE